MRSGCGDSIMDIPSSAGQLPVPVALNALSPTLFAYNIQDSEGKVNTFFHNLEYSGKEILLSFAKLQFIGLMNIPLPLPMGEVAPPKGR